VALPKSALQHPDVVALLSDTGETDPRLAIRRKVEGVIDRLRVLGEPSPPFDMTLLSSLLGIRLSADPPARSEDAEIGPGDDGRLELRLNRERPEVRRRFSIGHEIGHTFFPGYDQSVQTRRPKKRDWSDPDDVVEHLCDCAASELLFPLPWFADEVRRRPRTAEALIALAADYKASREAMLRRYAEIHEEAVAVAFLEWKLKPTQALAWDGVSAGDMLLGLDPREEVEDRKRLRVDYAIASDPFRERHASQIPPDKSIDERSVVYEASRTRVGHDASEWLDLGSVRGNFRVNAIPIPTPLEDRGPRGEFMVAVVLWPQDKGRKAKPSTAQPTMF
jgi:Zn-dependent peptidase ImmA (M78 family)